MRATAAIAGAQVRVYDRRNIVERAAQAVRVTVAYEANPA